MMVQFTQLFQGLFAYPPRSSLSFSNSCRKMMAVDLAHPATLWLARSVGTVSRQSLLRFPCVVSFAVDVGMVF
jgi:hypothetical protein